MDNENSNKALGCFKIILSISSFIFGTFMIFGLCVGLFFSENKFRKSTDLSGSLKDIISVSAKSIDSKNNGKPVHVIGTIKSSEELKDDFFGVSANVVYMKRNVEYYNWTRVSSQENRRSRDGNTRTVTTYSYQKGWQLAYINSNSFDQEHKNPEPQIRKTWKEFFAESASMGEFKVTAEFIENMNRANLDYLSLNSSVIKNIDDASLSMFQGVENAMIYFGSNSGSPEIGDVRVYFQVIKPGKYSVIAKQENKSLTSYQGKSGSDILYIKKGEMSPQEIYESEKWENPIMIWLIRIGGTILMFIGFIAVTRPIAAVQDSFPFFSGMAFLASYPVVIALSILFSLVAILLPWAF